MPELPEPQEEHFCLLVSQGDTYAGAGRAAKITSSDNDDVLRCQASRLARKDHIQRRIAELKLEHLAKLREMAKAQDVTREAAIERAKIGYNMAMEKGDPVAMSRHNMDMARLAGLLETTVKDSVMRLIDKAADYIEDERGDS